LRGSAWAAERLGRVVPRGPVDSRRPGNIFALTAISVFPWETILLNITKISSSSLSLAGLEFGPTRRKWSWFVKDHGKLLTGARKTYAKAVY
jgi:hypothetical protein